MARLRWPAREGDLPHRRAFFIVVEGKFLQLAANARRMSTEEETPNARFSALTICPCQHVCCGPPDGRTGGRAKLAEPTDQIHRDARRGVGGRYRIAAVRGQA